MDKLELAKFPNVNTASVRIGHEKRRVVRLKKGRRRLRREASPRPHELYRYEPDAQV